MDEIKIFTITSRQAKEIQFAIYYEEYGNHGTDGHNRLLLIAQMAKFLGFRNDVGNHLVLPGNVVIENEKTSKP